MLETGAKYSQVKRWKNGLQVNPRLNSFSEFIGTYPLNNSRTLFTRIQLGLRNERKALPAETQRSITKEERPI